jgi:hypothetical protein
LKHRALTWHQSHRDPEAGIAAHYLVDGRFPSTEDSRMTEDTRKVLEAYWTSHDPGYVAEDAVFTMMPTGEEIRGRDAIAKHLDAFYNKSLTAHAEVVSSMFADNKGLLEALVVGIHTGEFGGIPATGRNVRVPLAVSYEVDGGLIQRARIYLMANVLFGQITPP